MQTRQTKIGYYTVIMSCEITLSTVLQLSHYEVHPPQRLTSYVCPKISLWKIPDTQWIPKQRLILRRCTKLRPHLSPLLFLHTHASDLLLGYARSKETEPKVLCGSIHTHWVNKQERLPDKTKSNAKSRACLKAVFLKIHLFSSLFTHC